MKRKSNQIANADLSSSIAQALSGSTPNRGLLSKLIDSHCQMVQEHCAIVNAFCDAINMEAKRIERPAAKQRKTTKRSVLEELNEQTERLFERTRQEQAMELFDRLYVKVEEKPTEAGLFEIDGYKHEVKPAAHFVTLINSTN